MSDYNVTIHSRWGYKGDKESYRILAFNDESEYTKRTTPAIFKLHKHIIHGSHIHVYCKDTAGRSVILLQRDKRYGTGSVIPSVNRFLAVVEYIQHFTFLPLVEKAIDLHFEVVDHDDDIILKRRQKERDIARAAVAILIQTLTTRELKASDLDQIIEWPMQKIQDYPIFALAWVLTTVVDVLAFRQLNEDSFDFTYRLYTKQIKSSIDEYYCLGKFTGCRTKHLLPVIDKQCIVFKIETVDSIAGHHKYVLREDLDEFLENHLSRHIAEKRVLHIVQGYANYCVWDIDIKKTEVSQIHWDRAEAATFEHWAFALSSIQDIFIQFQLNHNRDRYTRGPGYSLTMYKTTTKVSLRVVLGVLLEVAIQRKIIEALKSSYETQRWYDQSLDRTEYLKAVLIKHCDEAVLRTHASIRLPFQGKIDPYEIIDDKGQTKLTRCYNQDKMFRSHSAKPTEADIIDYIKDCLPVYIEKPRIDIPIKLTFPIIPVQNATKYNTKVTVETIKAEYMKVAKVTYCDVRNYSDSCYQFVIAEPSWCPVCKKQHIGDHQIQNSAYFKSDGVYINCTSKGFDKEHVYRLIKFDKQEESKADSFDEVLQSRFDEISQSTLISKYLDDLETKNPGDIIRFNKRYITDRFTDVEDITNRRVNLICSPMGSAKSEMLIQIILKSGWCNILWLSARRSYSSNMMQRLNSQIKPEFYSYDDQAHINRKISGGRCICQIDSLGRVDIESFDFIILDEVHSLLQQMSEKTHLFPIFTKLIMKAQQCIALDAQLEISLFNVFQNLLITQLSDDGKDLDCDYNEDDGVIDFDRPRLIWNEYQPFTNRTATLYNHDLSKVYERSLAADIVYKDYTAGDNTYCYLSTIAQQDDLRQALIIKGIPESDICIVNSKMDTKAKELLFSDIKVQSAKYRVMITTSCISIGVDIDTDHYKKTLAVYSHNTASAQQFIQAAHRCRRLQHITMFIAEDRNASVYTTFDLAKSQKLKTTKNNALQYQTNPFHNYTHLYQLSLQNRPLSYTLHYMQQMGYQLVFREQLDIDIIKVKRQQKKTDLPVIQSDDSLLAAYIKFLAQELHQVELPDYTIKQYDMSRSTGKPRPEWIAEFDQQQQARAQQRIQDKTIYQDLLQSDAELTSELVELFKAASQVCSSDCFVRQPHSISRIHRNLKTLQLLTTYLTDINMPIHLLLKAHNNWCDGFIFRKARDIWKANPKLTNAQILQALDHSLSDSKQQQLSVLTQRELASILGKCIKDKDPHKDKNFIYRDIKQDPIKHGDTVERLPPTDAYQQRFRQSFILTKTSPKTVFCNLRFDDGFLFYSPTIIPQDQLEALYNHQRDRYKELNIKLILCSNPSTNK